MVLLVSARCSGGFKGSTMDEYINREVVCSLCNNQKEYCGKEKCPVYKAPAADVVSGEVHRRAVETIEKLRNFDAGKIFLQLSIKFRSGDGINIAADDNCKRAVLFVEFCFHVLQILIFLYFSKSDQKLIIVIGKGSELNIFAPLFDDHAGKFSCS